MLLDLKEGVEMHWNRGSWTKSRVVTYRYVRAVREPTTVEMVPNSSEDWMLLQGKEGAG